MVLSQRHPATVHRAQSYAHIISHPSYPRNVPKRLASVMAAVLKYATMSSPFLMLPYRLPYYITRRSLYYAYRKPGKTLPSALRPVDGVSVCYREMHEMETYTSEASESSRVPRLQAWADGLVLY